MLIFMKIYYLLVYCKKKQGIPPIMYKTSVRCQFMLQYSVRHLMVSLIAILLYTKALLSTFPSVNLFRIPSQSFDRAFLAIYRFIQRRSGTHHQLNAYNTSQETIYHHKDQTHQNDTCYTYTYYLCVKYIFLKFKQGKYRVKRGISIMF